MITVSDDIYSISMSPIGKSIPFFSQTSDGALLSCVSGMLPGMLPGALACDTRKHQEPTMRYKLGLS